MPEIPHDVLTPLIGRATDLCDAGMELIDSLRAENGTGATMPESTLVRLHFAASSTYRSALLCLWMPETSLAAYGLTRGLLEIWAHLAFIADDASGGDARCRALRYERGALAEWSATMKKAPDSYDRDTWQVRHDERQRDVDALWDEFCCKGSPRTRSHVKSTLDSLSKQPTMGWIPGVWSASSAATHAYGVDFTLHSRDGTTELVWALASQRATWLAFAVASFDYLTVTAANLLGEGEPRINIFQQAARGLLEDEMLGRVARREFDP